MLAPFNNLTPIKVKLKWNEIEQKTFDKIN